jgi:ABC-2 type transport system ATP-binding protein
MLQSVVSESEVSPLSQLSAPPAIHAESLSKRYGNGRSGGEDAEVDERAERLAVDNLSLQVMPGELFGFLGENGAGKTTTIKMLTGLIPPTSGVARIAGFDLKRDPLEAKRRVGYIPDNPFLYEKLTGREFLDFMGDLYAVPRTAARRARIDDLLTLFDLEDEQSALIGGYSRGMRQKIALAGALLHDPEALFLDEPTVGLDPKSVRRLQDVLRAVAARGAAVFFSTHVLDVAAGLCDRIGILHKGRLVALGTPAELTRGGERTLEEVFLGLTGGLGAIDEVSRLLGGPAKVGAA